MMAARRTDVREGRAWALGPRVLAWASRSSTEPAAGRSSCGESGPAPTPGLPDVRSGGTSTPCISSPIRGPLRRSRGGAVDTALRALDDRAGQRWAAARCSLAWGCSGNNHTPRTRDEHTTNRSASGSALGTGFPAVFAR